METNPLTLDKLFSKDVHYSIPNYQRRYKWIKGDQWAPLWQDVRTTAEKFLGGGSRSVRSHFLGAIVLQAKPNSATEPPLYEVIDGQQRLATLQLLVGAVASVLSELGQNQAGFLEPLVQNRELFEQADPKYRFKISLTPHDQADFTETMAGQVSDVDEESGIAGAYSFFRREVRYWLTQAGESAQENRAEALLNVLKTKLNTIAIETDSDDDSNLIFETLNARGTPLLAWDLTKNQIINGIPQDAGLDLVDFDSDWWQEEIGAARNKRTRIDNLLVIWLTMRTKVQVNVKTARHIFDAFRQYVAERDSALESIAQDLVNVSEHYRKMEELDDSSPLGQFLQRWRVLPQGSFNPVILWLMAELDLEDPFEAEQQRIGCLAIESYFVRRMITGASQGGGGQDLMTIALDLLDLLDDVEKDEAGYCVARRLRDSRKLMACPDDGQLRAALVEHRPIYRRLNRRQAAMVLRAVEERLRSDKAGVPVPTNMTIEHLMPQSYKPAEYPHPEVDIAHDQEAQDARRHLIDTIGNLTLVTQKLNSTMSNAPWPQKRAKLEEFDVLLINKTLSSRRRRTWDENDIRRRSNRMAELCAEIWPTPERLLPGT